MHMFSIQSINFNYQHVEQGKIFLAVWKKKYVAKSGDTDYFFSEKQRKCFILYLAILELIHRNIFMQ